MDKNESIEIPFGAKDSELKGWEYTIPESMEAIIKDGKIIVREKESEDERIRKQILDYFMAKKVNESQPILDSWITWLEKQGSQNLANSAKTRKDEQNLAWSDEDERVLSLLLNNYKQAVEHRPSSLTHVEVLDIYNWLKSIKERCTWKPSDEQLDGIKCAIKTLQYQLNVGDKRLDSLYNDLKKLKG